jgi:hypothetical protein
MFAEAQKKGVHMRFSPTALLMVATLVFSGVAVAQPRPGGGPKPPGGGSGPSGGGAPAGLIVKLQAEQIAQLFSEAGFQSKIIDNNNTHMIQTLFWTDQVFSGAIPEACEKDGSGCHAFKVFANLGPDTGVSQAWIDAWNNNWLYVRASKTQDGSLIFTWDVALLTGVTADYVRVSAKLFKTIVDSSSDFKP